MVVHVQIVYVTIIVTNVKIINFQTVETFLPGGIHLT